MAEKKHSNILLLNILKECSDEDHILPLKELQSLLQTRYGIVLERRAIYSNLEILRQEGYEISDYNDNGKGYYLLSRQFDKGEVLLLCNAIHASHFISQKQSKKLIETLLATLSRFQQKEFTDKVYMPNPQKTLNRELMYNVETVSEAIREGRFVKFDYLKYNRDKKLVQKKNEPYSVEPRYIVYADSRAYMIATDDKHEGFAHYRLDRMANAVIEDKKARRLPKTVDAYEYARNKLFMYSGETERVTFRCDDRIMDQMIDIFGTDVTVISDGSDHFDLSVRTSRTGARYLAQQFMEYIEVLEPLDLREEFKENLKAALKKYR